MKTFLKAAFVMLCLPLVMLMQGCSDRDDPEPVGNEEQPTETRPVTLRVYPASDQGRRPMIHLTAEYGDWHISEIQDPDAADIKTWLFVNGKENVSTIVTVSEEMICFQGYDINKGASDSEAYYFIPDGKSGFTACRCRVGTNDRDTEILEIIPLEASDETMPAPSRAQNDGFDDTRAILDRMFTELGEKIDDLGTFLPSDISGITSVWTQLAVPMARMTLYSNDPQKIEEIHREYIIDTAEGETVELFVDVVLPAYKDLLDNLKKAYVMSKYFLGLSDWDEDEYYEWFQSIEDSRVEDDIEEFSVFSSSRQPKIMHLMSEVGQYTINTRVYNVGLTDAWATAEVIQNGYGGSYISECGIVLTDVLKKKTVYRASTFGSGIHLDNLTQNTTYSATSYIKSYGTTYYGSTVKFTTDVEFSVTPESITFGPEGGSRGVYVNLPDDSWAWDITDKPSWCTITKSATSFFVDVAVSGASRAGVITLTGKSKKYGGEETCQLSVTQTSGYLFGGKVSVTMREDDGSAYSDEVEYMAFVQKAGDTYLLTYTGGATDVIYVSQDIRQQPETAIDYTHVTSYTQNFTADGFSISGKIGGSVEGNRISGHFNLTADLTAGTFKIDEFMRVSDSEYWVEYRVSGTLSLSDLPDGR